MSQQQFDAGVEPFAFNDKLSYQRMNRLLDAILYLDERLTNVEAHLGIRSRRRQEAATLTAELRAYILRD
jgi:hypothetical protein